MIFKLFTKTFQWFFVLTKSGDKSDLNNELGRRVVFSNIIYISLPVVYFIFMALDYQSYLQLRNNLNFDQFIIPIVISICFFCLWLNKINRTLLSRNLFLLSWPFLLQIIPLKLIDAPIDYILAFPVGLIFHSILVQLMLSHRKEKFYYWSWLVINLLTMFFMSNILDYFDSDHSNPKVITLDKFYKLDSILYWFLFNMVVFFIILELERNIQKILNSNLLIEEQKFELNTINDNLEEIISQRTMALEEQNKKLRNYAFYNAHLLRGPFCRIQGLLNVRELNNESKEEEELIKVMLNKSIEELDNRIQEIQLIVRENEMFK